MDPRCCDMGGDPRAIMATLCPVCMNPLRGVVYEHKTHKMTGFEVGPASKGPSELTVDTYIRTEMFACGLERSRAYTEHGWRPYVFSDTKKCLNAQSTALALHEMYQASKDQNLDIADKLAQQMEVNQDGSKEKRQAIIPEGHENQGPTYEPEIVWCKCGEPARSCSCG